mmetsp:Transcript_16790/g.46062  ORF Transcript_16790/g.46062 Transcript_16790/m.46062 type:complete len:339 (-) Transcript_16790:548-1564(-)
MAEGPPALTIAPGLLIATGFSLATREGSKSNGTDIGRLTGNDTGTSSSGTNDSDYGGLTTNSSGCNGSNVTDSGGFTRTDNHVFTTSCIRYWYTLSKPSFRLSPDPELGDRSSVSPTNFLRRPSVLRILGGCRCGCGCGCLFIECLPRQNAHDSRRRNRGLDRNLDGTQGCGLVVPDGPHRKSRRDGVRRLLGPRVGRHYRPEPHRIAPQAHCQDVRVFSQLAAIGDRRKGGVPANLRAATDPGQEEKVGPGGLRQSVAGTPAGIPHHETGVGHGRSPVVFLHERKDLPLEHYETDVGNHLRHEGGSRNPGHGGSIPFGVPGVDLVGCRGIHGLFFRH